LGDPDGEIAYILKREQCGWTFCIGEATSLAWFIQALSEDPDKVANAGARARLVFEQYYARSRALDAWRDLLGSLSGPGAMVPHSTSEALPVPVGRS
jgi:hypothetical protein